AGGDRSTDDARLAVGGGPESPQVARRDAEVRELRAGNRDVDVALAVALLAVLRARLDEPVVLQLACELAADPGTSADLREVEVVLAAEPERPRPLAVLPS